MVLSKVVFIGVCFFQLHLCVFSRAICSEVIREPMFWFFATASGLLGLAISFSSVWFLQETGPTTYRWDDTTNSIPSSKCPQKCLHFSKKKNACMTKKYHNNCNTIKVLDMLIITLLLFSLVGSLNKIPISVAGVLLFNVPVSVENLFSIVFGEYFFPLLLGYVILCYLATLRVYLWCIFLIDLNICRSFCWDILCKGKDVQVLMFILLAWL